ncbi:MAG: inositol 2-dehydrogenase [Chloroflexi bacterium]|jgi:myo-inositol 2-dehydrogenase/D-chiro-inositol 1-dehydrogenase|nr:MAG: inositol 2-dehydrogenase [Chloroflexi bacterium OLB13]MBC6955563.1 inositol 2-dehydrogenase [Chloroflexota bacterium]MBV6435756.1 Myo-inositol 2-dehydrogenase [Anaerolineae bacterium]MDL1916807.1 inositol 2-dehydrogenase [Anaerolineae bacterium CFX4]OQY79435.1 MAG: inositol 2-dehydrogenase [Anaerolineae bacterium UTCFX5]
MTIRFGVIGAGRIGRIHADNIATRVRNAELLWIADINLTAADALAARFHEVSATDEYKRILDDPRVDAILIASATPTHADIIVEAAEAGKHIFCEKPIDYSLSRIDRALHAVENADVRLQIGFNRRFDSNHRRVRQAIMNGEIGDPHRVHIISRDPSPPPIEYVKVSGGMFFDMTIHDFDMARFLTGSEAEEIFAVGGVMVDPAIGEAGDLDTAVIVMRFANGVLVTIDNSRRAVYGYDQRVEVFGSGGSVYTENLYANQAHIQTTQGVWRDLPLHFFLERYENSFITELNEFTQALLSDTPVPVSGLDGRAPVVMAMAAKKSVELNRPVKVTEIEG